MKPPILSPETVLVNIKERLNKLLGLTPTRLKMLVEKFVRETMHLTGSKVHFTRVNTYNEFATNKMTIKVFFKYLHIIGAESVEFKVKVRVRGGLEAEASQIVNLTRGEPSQPQPEKDTQMDLPF